MTAVHPDPSFDRELRRSLTAADRGAADTADVLRVAKRVRAGDVAGWEREWQRIADGALAGGDELLGADDPDGACRAFLQAAEYYRRFPAGPGYGSRQRVSSGHAVAAGAGRDRRHR
jgi:hypothetical protein